MLLLGSIAGGFDLVFEQLVNEGIDAADEEAGNRGHVADIFASGAASFQGANERLGDLLVGTDREDKRDVDVDALGQGLENGGNTFRGSGYLDHQVGSINHFPEPAYF